MPDLSLRVGKAEVDNVCNLDWTKNVLHFFLNVIEYSIRANAVKTFMALASIFTGKYPWNYNCLINIEYW